MRANKSLRSKAGKAFHARVHTPTRAHARPFLMLYLECGTVRQNSSGIFFSHSPGGPFAPSTHPHKFQSEFPPNVLSDKEDEAPPHNQTDPNPDSGRPRKASTRLGQNNKTFSSSGKKKRGSEKKRGLSLSSLFFCVLFPTPPSPPLPFSFYPQLCALRARPD